MRSAAIYVGPDFVGDRWQHFRLQFGLNVVNLEYLTMYICGWVVARTLQESKNTTFIDTRTSSLYGVIFRRFGVNEFRSFNNSTDKRVIQAVI